VRAVRLDAVKPGLCADFCGQAILRHQPSDLFGGKIRRSRCLASPERKDLDRRQCAARMDRVDQRPQVDAVELFAEEDRIGRFDDYQADTARRATAVPLAGFRRGEASVDDDRRHDDPIAQGFAFHLQRREQGCDVVSHSSDLSVHDSSVETLHATSLRYAAGRISTARRR
jgi:hypothetical protein